MKSIGFPISHKENENRRAIIPAHLKILKHPKAICIEEGYGAVLGYDDSQYIAAGAKVVDRESILRCDVICDPKIGDAEYLSFLSRQTIFGWVHAVQNLNITQTICANNLTAIAWEDMYDDGKHLFYRNNEIAGEAAILHAFLRHGIFPKGLNVAVLGRGNTAMGALKALHQLGATVTMYDKKTEQKLVRDLPIYDVIVNAIPWDTKRKDHIIYKKDLGRMKKGALIIDISCDHEGAIETSTPTTIENPDYVVEGIRHYVVDHTPSLFYKTSSIEISNVVHNYLDKIIEGNHDAVLRAATCIEAGTIKDSRIIEYQHINRI